MRLKRDRFNTLVGKQAKPAVAAAAEPVVATPPLPPAPPTPPTVDLSGLEKRMEGMEKMLRGIFINQARTSDAAPVVVAPPVPPVDLAGVGERLSGVERTLRDLVERKPADVWVFDVQRDRSGKIVSVEASRKAETTAPLLA